MQARDPLRPADGVPTVGDTIWSVRLVRVPAGAQVRAPDWTPEGPIERLGAARITRRGDEAEVAWPLVGWAPGTHALEIPGPLLVYADGREDTLSAQSLAVTVASVLPSRARETLQPQPAAEYVARRVTSVVPPLVGLAVAAVITAGLLWARRRRRPVPPLPPPLPLPPAPAARWREAGEWRLLLEQMAVRLAGRAQEPAVAAWLAEAETARFAGPEAGASAALLARGEALEAGR